jgi:O-antigen/teichoic acid export membrane protein
LVIQIVSAAILARLLTPRDFGLVTMVTTFSLLLMNFGLNGFTEAVMQRESVDDTLASNLFWINAGGSLVLSIAFAAASPILARIYSDPRIVRVAEVMSVTIFLTGLSVLHLALLKRAMLFGVVSANDFVAKAVSVLVAILFGWAGWGYWSLVAGAVTLAASTCIGGWVFCLWLPSLPKRDAATGSAVRFAMSTYGRFVTGYFSGNFDNFLVGWRLGATTLGFYKKAYDLFVLPTGQLSLGLTNVAVAALSRFQRDVVQYKRYFLGALGVMAFVGMGLSGDLTLIGKDLIFVLLGPKWGESGRIFTIFGPGIGMMLLYCSHIWIHLSIGRADRWFRWGLVDMAITALFLVVGLQWGAEGIAVAWVAAYWLITLPALWYAGQPIQLGMSPVVRVIWKYVLSAIMAGIVAFLIAHAIPSLEAQANMMRAATRLVAISSLFTALYLGAIVILHRGCAPIYQVLGLFREMISRRKASDETPTVEQLPGASEPAPQNS